MSKPINIFERQSAEPVSFTVRRWTEAIGYIYFEVAWVGTNPSKLVVTKSDYTYHPVGSEVMSPDNVLTLINGVWQPV